MIAKKDCRMIIIFSTCMSLGFAGIQNSAYTGLNDTLLNDEGSLLEGLASNEPSTLPEADTSTSSANFSSEDGPNRSLDEGSDNAVLETETSSPSDSNPSGDGNDEKISVEDVGKLQVQTTTVGSGQNKLQIRHISQEKILNNPSKVTGDSAKHRLFDLKIECNSDEAAVGGGFWLRTLTAKVISSSASGHTFYLTMEAGPGSHQTLINVNCLSPLS